MTAQQRIRIFLKQCLSLCLVGSMAVTSANPTRSPSVWDILRDEFKLDHAVVQPEVQAQIHWLVTHPSYLEQLAESERYMYHIVTEIKKRGLPGELALLPMIESSYDPFAYSGAGAAGLWQIMPNTGSELGLVHDWWYDGRRSIGASTNAALNYLDYLRNFFNNNWLLAIASYDAGEGTISRALARRDAQKTSFWRLQVPRETRAYVPRLLALAELIKYPDYYHVKLPYIPYQPYFEEVNIGSQIDLNQAAKLAGVSYHELLKLNPGFNHWATSPYQPFKLLIPAQKVANFYFQLAKMPQKSRVSWAQYEVKTGDNLAIIAKKFFTTTKLLKELNQLKTEKVKRGQKILIPGSKQVTMTPSSATHAASNYKHIVPVNRLPTYKVLHIVQPKDTIISIAEKYHVTPATIRQWNNIQENSTLHTNQALVIWKSNTTKGVG